jgi:beta-lactamase superfamily II metal-dependent hydrolase
MDIGHIGEIKNPQRHQEVHRIAGSLGAERFASSRAASQANRLIHQPLPQQDNIEFSDDAVEALSAPNEVSSSRRTDQLVTALKQAWGHVGQEPARQDGRGQRRSA